MKVPYIDLARQHESLIPELTDAIVGVLSSGRFILGDKVEEFEHNMASLVGTRHAVGLGSGTEALIQVLRALEIGRGDEVITAANSFIASASAIWLAGAVPVLADVGDDENLSPESVASRVTKKTRAIIAVHLRGEPAPMRELQKIADRHGLALIEDASQAIGSRYCGQPVGAIGLAACFSLHPLKTLGACGDAGVVTTKDSALADRLRLLRNHGLRDRDHCETWGSNSRIDAVQAAILNVKLGYLGSWIEKRRENAARYRECLSDLPIRLPSEGPDSFATYHAYVIRTGQRDALRRWLKNREIEALIHYPVPICRQAAYVNTANGGQDESGWKNTIRQCGRILSLPIADTLSSAQVELVIETVREFFHRNTGVPDRSQTV